MIQEMKEQGKTRVLLVEDDEDFSEALIRRLAKRDFKVTMTATAEEALATLRDKELEVTTVPSAEEGLDKISTKDFDAIIADIKLPKMDGIDFLRRVRKLDANIPVIMLTGYASLESAKEAVHLRAFDYLLKPLENIDELLDPLQKAVANFRLLREKQRLTTQLSSLTELANDVIFTTDHNGVITAINRRVEEVTGYLSSELIGKPMELLFTSVEDEGHQKKFKQLKEGTPKDRVEVELRSKNGECRVIAELSMRAIPVNDVHVGMHGALRDITERKKAEEENMRHAVDQATAEVEHQRAEDLEDSYAKLQQKTDRLERFHKLTVDRELEMVRLKQKVNDLLRKLNMPKEFDVPNSV